LMCVTVAICTYKLTLYIKASESENRQVCCNFNIEVINING
jgi:hypothetical protein